MSDDCSICMMKMDIEITLSCKHGFCSTCINIWAKTNKTCPLCRRPFTDKDLICFEEWVRKQVIGHISEGESLYASEDFLYWERQRIFGGK